MAGVLLTSDFYKVPNAMMMTHGRELGPTGIAVYSSLACHADKQGTSWPSYGYIAREIGASRGSVIKAIKKLEDLGLVVVIRRRNTSNLYALSSTSPTASSPHPPGSPGGHRSTPGELGVVHPAHPPGSPGGHEPYPVNHTQLNQHAADEPPRAVGGASPDNPRRSETLRGPSWNRFSDTASDTPDTSASGKAPSNRDELFDAVAQVTGSDRLASGSHIGRVCKNLRKASPPYSPDEVRTWAALVQGEGWFTGFPSLGHLEKTIGRVRARPPATTRAPRETDEQARERIKQERTKEATKRAAGAELVQQLAAQVKANGVHA